MSGNFETWKRKMHREISKRLRPDDAVPDVPDSELVWWWQDELSPTEAAKKALNYVGYPSGGG